MGLNDQFKVIICLFLPAIYCGTISDYLLIHQRLWELLLYRGSLTPEMTSVNVPSKTTMSNIYLQMNNSRLGESYPLVTKLEVPRLRNNNPNVLSVISRDLSRLPSPYVNMYSPHDENIQPVVGKRLISKQMDARVEILLVVDNSIFRKYLREHDYKAETAKQKIVQYYSILFAIVNQRYETIRDKPARLHIDICDIFIAETRRDAAWLELLAKWSNTRMNGVISASRALKRFQKWLRRNKALPNYDHAVIVTSYILSKKRKQVDGLAYVGTMCKVSTGKSASIVQDTGDFQSAGVIAHELGHSLGVTHDGVSANRACPATDNHVMAPQNSHADSVIKNVFYFSTCSVRQIKTFLSSSQASCLYNKPSKTISHDLLTSPPGKIFTEDAQCEMGFGPEWTFCSQGSSRSTMCSRLWCTSPGENVHTCRSNSRLMALPGTSCGYRMHCHLGECVSEIRYRMSPHFQKSFLSKNFLRNENCPMGDRNTFFCPAVVRLSPDRCRKPSFETYCCESCNNPSLTMFKR